MTLISLVVTLLHSPLALNSGIWRISQTFRFWFHQSSKPDPKQCLLRSFHLERPEPLGLMVGSGDSLLALGAGDGDLSESASDYGWLWQMGHLLSHGIYWRYSCWVKSSSMRSHMVVDVGRCSFFECLGKKMWAWPLPVESERVTMTGGTGFSILMSMST